MSVANRRTDEGSGVRFLGWGLGLLIAPWVLLIGVSVLFIRDGMPESSLSMLQTYLVASALLSFAGAGLLVAAVVYFASNSSAKRRL